MASQQTLEKLRIAKSVAREPYAWPGGYPRFLVTRDGGCLCPKCVRSEYREIARSALTRHVDSGWHPDGYAINWEDDSLFCDHCGEQIEAAYSER